MFTKFYCFVSDDYFKKLSSSCRKMTSEVPASVLSAQLSQGVKRKREDTGAEDRSLEKSIRRSEESLFRIVKPVDESAVYGLSDGSDKENEDGDLEAERLEAQVSSNENNTEVPVQALSRESPVADDGKEEKEAVSRDGERSIAADDKTAAVSEGAEIVNSSIDGSEEADYEVEAIVNYKMCRKRKEGLYLVKWYGWGHESNTWEPLSHVEHCTEHLHTFYKSRLDARSGATPAQKRSLELPPRPPDYEEREFREAEEEPEEEYEVEDIMDYQYCRDRQAGLYLVKWVGWDHGSDTWEPETNLGCTDLLAEFYKRRLAEREGASPVEKRSKPLPPDPRETFQQRQDFLREHVPSPTKKQLERIFLTDREKPAAKRAKLVTEKCINEVVDKCIKSSRPNEQKLQWIREQTSTRKMILARRKQLAELKVYEDEINEIDPHARVSVINEVDLEGPPRQMKYINAYRAGDGISIPEDPLIGCSCEQCDLRSKSCCPNTSGDFHFPYTKHGKLREVIGVSF